MKNNLRLLFAVGFGGGLGIYVIELFVLLNRLVNQNVVHVGGVAYYPMLIAFEAVQTTLVKLFVFAILFVVSLICLFKLRGMKG